MTTDGAPGDRGLRGIVVGTAGHVDHGKTTLVGALTGVETDRWREERERGLTIDIGFAPLELAPDIETGVVDVPGHEDFLKNMLAGATGIDLLLLVVAADEGPMPQTREHLAIAHLLDVRRGVVALTKRDRVDEEWLALAEEATEELLEENGFGQWPIIPVSSVSGEGIEDLVAALRGAAVDLESRDQADLFRLPVDRVFSVHGTGTVVTGTVWSGTVGIGETVRLLPGTATARVRGLEVHGDSRGGVAAGRRCALALVGVDATDAERGTVVVSDPAWRSVRRLGVRIETLARPGRPIEQSQRLRLYLGTREVMARVATLEADPIAPGASGWAVLTLESPLVARVRDRGVLRFYSPVTTIGGVRVCELDPPLSWADRVEDWGVMIAAPPEEALEACVTLAGPRGLEVTASPLALGLPPSSVGAAAVGIDAMRLGDRWYSVEARSDTMVAVRDAVERLHAADRRAAGVSIEAVRSALSSTRSAELVQACLEHHLTEGSLTASGPLVSFPGAGATLTPAEQAHFEALVNALAAGGLQPPTVNDLTGSLRVSRDVLDDLLRLLVGNGDACAVTPEIYVNAAAMEALGERVREMLSGGKIGTPKAFKDEFSLSRKYLIPLLEYLDRTGVTRRVSEGRILVG